MIVGFELARQALTHPDLLKNPEPAAVALAAAGYTLNKPGEGLGGQMLESDPPEHTRLRRLVSVAFTPRRTQLLGPRIREIADSLIEKMAPLGEVDLVESFTAQLPVIVIAELLGIDDKYRSDFREWTSKALDVTASGHKDALRSLHALLGELVEMKRENPQDDLLSDMVRARDEDGGLLTDTELIGTAILLVVAGHETTVNLLGNSMMALIRHPDQASLLREDPTLIPAAVEEFLRYDSSVEVSTLRYVAADVVLGGRQIPRGSIVSIALASAGRDAPVADGQDALSLDVTRRNARHIAFGHGIHHCLGAPLARLEASIALEALLVNLPAMSLTVPEDEINWIPAGMMRGPLRLPVKFHTQEAS